MLNWIRGLPGIFADITSGRRTAQEAPESAAPADLETASRADYLQQLVDQIPAFLWVIDRDLVVRRIEGGRPMLKALDRDRLIGLPMAEVTGMGSSPEDIELSVAMHRRVLAGAAEQYRATWKGITLEARIRPLRDADNNIVGILGVGIDVTDQTRMQEQLRDSEERLRQSQKLEALGQLAGGVAHDFNNILAAIIGYTQLLQQGLAHDDRRRDDVEEILKAAERATNITRQLLAFGRQQAPAAVRLDLVEAVHAISRMLRALMPATIALRVLPERGGSPIDVFADPGQLDQMIINLAVNARDAMPAGGTLSIDVRAGTAADAARTAVLEIRDTGIGMSPEVQTHVFEPFFTTKELGRGTGLGLATVYGIVRQHSGSIEIASAEGEGTTVTVRLPLAPRERAEPAAAGAERVEPDRGGRVLVVEDEAQVRDLTARFLRHSGYEVVTASDGETALEVLGSAGRFDLVITDSAMPGMRGEDFAAEIGRVHPGLPVILMSGYAEPTTPAAPGPVAAFVQKPFTLDIMLAEVRRVIARERPGKHKSGKSERPSSW